MDGVLYVATARKYLYEAQESAKSVKLHNDISVSVITTDQLLDELENKNHPFDSVIVADHVYDDLRDWLFNLHQSPYQKTLYLDTDTHVVSDITDIFTILSNFDIAVTNSPQHRLGGVEIPNISESVPQINTGVLGFCESDQVHEYFDEARRLYQLQLNGKRCQGLQQCDHPGVFHDQYPLTEALYNSNLRFVTLPREYNFRGSIVAVDAEVKIVHLRNKHLDGLIKIVNDRIDTRVFLQQEYKIYYENGETTVVERPYIERIATHRMIKSLFKKIGLFDSMKKFYQKLSDT